MVGVGGHAEVKNHRMPRFETLVSERGLVVEYRRDRAGIDTGLYFFVRKKKTTPKGMSGRTAGRWPAGCGSRSKASTGRPCQPRSSRTLTRAGTQTSPRPAGKGPRRHPVGFGRQEGSASQASHGAVLSRSTTLGVDVCIFGVMSARAAYRASRVVRSKGAEPAANELGTCRCQGFYCNLIPLVAAIEFVGIDVATPPVSPEFLP